MAQLISARGLRQHFPAI